MTSATSRFGARPWRAVTWLSGITYPVYLFHNWIWPYLGLVVNRPEPSTIWVELAIAGMVVGLSAAAHLLVERPSVALGARLAARGSA